MHTRFDSIGNAQLGQCDRHCAIIECLPGLCIMTADNLAVAEALLHLRMEGGGDYWDAGMIGCGPDLLQVLKVDRSSGTVAGALQLGQALVDSWGPIFGAEYVLPVLSPCLAAPSLSREQFRAVFK